MNTNITKVYITFLLILMSLAIIPVPNVSAGPGANYFTTINVDFDSYLYNITSTWHNDSNLLVTNYTTAPPPLATRRLVTEWNVSEIPNDATITQVNVRYYLVQGTARALTRNYMYSLSYRPSTNNFTTVFDDCADGTLVVDSLSDFDGPAGWKNITYLAWATHLQNNLTNDYFALGWFADESGANSGDDNITIYSMEEPGSYAMQLLVWYTAEAPHLDNPSPPDAGIAIGSPVTTSIRYSHSDGQTATINWSVYINSTDVWYQYDSDASVTANTSISAVMPSNISTINQTYNWSVRATDANGNMSVRFYNFTITSGVLPPSGVVCTRNGSTGINISFTKHANGSGTSWTVCRYQTGSPPGWDEGTLAGNTTGELIEVTNLSLETCYVFSLWTNFNLSNTWYRSSRVIEPSCCTSGRNYTAIFRYENTSYATGNPLNEEINLSKFDSDSLHRLTVVFTDGSQQYIFYNATSFTNDGHAYTPFQTNNTVLYFELWWNYSSDSCNTTNSYTRRLLPASADSNGNITFYLITDSHIVDEYFYTNCSPRYHAYFNESLAKYIYQFVDTTATFTGQSGFYSYVTVWKRNASGTQIIVHQDYIDASDRIYATLLYGENYYLGINASAVSNGHLYENIGLAPTSKDIDPNFYEVIIKPRTNASLEYAQEFGNLITTRWLSVGTGFYVYYYDESLSTTTVNCTITRFDTDAVVYQYEVDNAEYTFNFTSASQSLEYIINITITTPNGTAFFTYPFSTAPQAIVDTTYVESVLQGLFGNLPANLDTGERINYTMIIVFVIGLIPISIFGAYQPSYSAIGLGIWFVGGNFMLSMSALLGPGILLILVGILYFWIKGDRR